MFGLCISIHIGAPLIVGGTVRLQKLIGVSRALDLVLTRQPVSAEETLQMGLANRVVTKGKPLEAAVAQCKQIGGFSPRVFEGGQVITLLFSLCC